MEYEKCEKCNETFVVSEHHLQMPGTKEREPIICPYCKHINGERVSNGWWNTRKLTEEEQKKLNRTNKNVA